MVMLSPVTSRILNVQQDPAEQVVYCPQQT